VPTLSLAYSVKAVGLNRLLFGHTDFVILPERMRALPIADATLDLLHKGDGVRADLLARGPSFRASALSAGTRLAQCLSRQAAA
jgi:hypothetical protein